MYIVIYGVIALIILSVVIPVSTSAFAAISLVLAVVAVIAIAKRNFDLKKSISKYPENLLIIQNVKEGGVIKLANVDGYNQDLDLKVIGRNLYMEGDYSWYELECVRNDGEKVWVDVEDDDDLIVSVVLKKIPNSEIMPSKTYEEFDEDESGYVYYENAKYMYKDSGVATFYKHCDDSHKERVQYFDFVNSKYMVSVERWLSDENKPDVLTYFSQIIKPASITVYSTGNEVNK